MKKLYIIWVLILSTLYTMSGQEIRQLKIKHSVAGSARYQQPVNSQFAAASCGQDTLQYSRAKALLGDSSLSAIGLSGSVTGVAQRFEVPYGETVNVAGFTLFGRSGEVNGLTVPVRCALYLADSLTGLPVGAALAADTIVLDTASSTLMDQVDYATFYTPIAMTQDFVIAVENLSSSLFAAVLMNNDGFTAGQGENLGLIKQSGNWILSTSTGPPPNGFNIDFLLEPHVFYDITAGINSDVDSLIYYDSLYTFQSNHSALLSSRFYNQLAFDAYFNGTPDVSTEWDFGDGTVTTGDSVTHTYAAGSTSFSITSVATMQGYAIVCTDTAVIEFDATMFVGLEDELLQTLKLFPNPTAGIIHLRMEMEKAHQVHVSLRNLMGQQLEAYSLGTTQSVSLDMDMTRHAAGMYLLYIDVDGTHLVRKLQVQ